MTSWQLRVKIAILFLLLGIVLVLWFPVINVSGDYSKYLTVRFLDVGQGDAIHVVTPDGFELLIDGGATASVLRELATDRSFFDRHVDMIIATHPDTDHVGGLVDVLKRYEVDWIIQSGVEAESPAANSFQGAVKNESARIVTAQAGQVFQLGASTTIKILSPIGDASDWPSNNASVIIQIIYGEIEFMLTGDAPSATEEYLVDIYGASLESEVLKLGHHGSKTSSSGVFLDTVQPEFAVVSAGADNRYGHPHFSVIDRVWKVGAKVLSTPELGTIVFQSDSKDVWIVD